MSALRQAFTFRLLEHRDLAMLHEWLGRPHVAEWWHGQPTLREVEEEWEPYMLGESGVEPFIAKLDGEPLGYIQSYRVMNAGGGWWPDACDPGARGIDQFIANPAQLGRGLGREMIGAFVRRLFADPAVSDIQTDPSPVNARAIRCYERVGFRAHAEVITPDGPALLMKLQRGWLVPRDTRTS